MSKCLRRLRNSTLLILLTLTSSCGFDVKMGSETKVLRESKEGTAIAPVVDVTVKCLRKQADGSIKVEKVVIKKYTVIRAGIECVFKDIDQVLTQEDVTFDAMTPDKDGKLGLSRTEVPKLTGLKIGTTTWTPPNAATAEAPPEIHPVDQSKLPVSVHITDPTPDMKPMPEKP
jgi:hypothetical protein